MTPRSGPTTWASAVSQNQTPGSSAARARKNATSPTASTTSRSATRASGRPSRDGAGKVIRAGDASPSEEVPPDDAPQVDEHREHDQHIGAQPKPAVASLRPEGDERQRERHEVVREAIAPLHPALAEVRQVEQGDEDDRDDAAAD